MITSVSSSLQHGDKVSFLCKCSFLEIYNEQIFDLLDTAAVPLMLREDIKRGTFVDGLVEHTVANASEAYNVGLELETQSKFPPLL